MKPTIWQYFNFIVMVSMTTVVNAEMTDVSCVYETSIQIISDIKGHSHHKDVQKTSKWYFWRTAKQVEVSNEEMNFGEKWISNGKQTVFYQVLYHDKKFLIDFQPTDLKILGKHVSWEIRSTLFPQNVLQQLQKKGPGTFHQYKTVHYQGTVAGVSYQVEWIPELELPFRVEKYNGNNTIITELKEVYPLDKTPHKQLISDNYEDMEYADIGDNESHPMVTQLQKNIGISYFHQH